MATGDLHNKFCEDRSSSSRDTLEDRQTHTHTDDKPIAILCSPTGWSNKTKKLYPSLVYVLLMPANGSGIFYSCQSPHRAHKLTVM